MEWSIRHAAAGCEGDQTGHYGIIVIGASAGGLEALLQVTAELPADLPAAVFVVWHLAADSPGILPEIISRQCRIPAVNAQHLERVQNGVIYVAPPDKHLVLERGFMRVTRGPKENRFRPAIDPLFRSAAAAYGHSVIGVILSGALDDGTSGLLAIKQRGGLAVVQHPDDALFASMPRSALTHVPVDHCTPASKLAALLEDLARGRSGEEGAPTSPDHVDIEVDIAMEKNPIEAGSLKLGQPTPFTCPECHGSLRELRENGHVRFRCYTGHAYTAQALLAEASEAIQDYLSTAIRGVEESMLLLRHMSHHLIDQGRGDEAALFEVKAQQAHRRAELLRQAALDQEQLPEMESGGLDEQLQSDALRWHAPAAE